MKFRKYCVLLIVLALLISPCGCFSGGKSLNVKIMETTKSTVRFRPVCPECDAVGKSRTETLYAAEGDIFTGVETCEECGHVFDIGVTRN